MGEGVVVIAFGHVELGAFHQVYPLVWLLFVVSSSSMGEALEADGVVDVLIGQVVQQAELGERGYAPVDLPGQQVQRVGHVRNPQESLNAFLAGAHRIGIPPRARRAVRRLSCAMKSS